MGDFITSQGLGVSALLGLIGLAVLVLSADIVVNKLVRLANYFHLSTTFMGMTVVSLATSIPEISSHLTASAGILRGTLDYRISSAIVLGANIGSDVVQQTLILGIVVLLAGSLYFRHYFINKSLLPMIATALVTMALGWDGVYSRSDGLILFGLFVAYTYFLYRDERRFYRPGEETAPAVEDVPQSGREALKDALIALGAMVLTVGGAQLVLSVTEVVVQRTGVGGSLIGVVTLGVASALPELTTAVSGIRKKEHGISLGTLVGSNITNPLVAIGLGGMLSTYWVPSGTIQWDMPWQAGSGIILWLVLWATKGKLNKLGAFYLIALYILYIGLRMVFFAVD